jgi:hypothetical protein
MHLQSLLIGGFDRAEKMRRNFTAILCFQTIAACVAAIRTNIRPLSEVADLLYWLQEHWIVSGVV